jgi:hypothetical protein
MNSTEENIRIRALVHKAKHSPDSLSLNENIEVLKNYHRSACCNCRGGRGFTHVMFGDNILDCKWCNGTGWGDYWQGQPL